MAKSKYDWKPFFDAFHQLPQKEQIKRVPNTKHKTIEDHCEFLVKMDKVTPLHLAAHCGLLDVCKYYLDAGVDVNAKACLSVTPLYEAAWEPQWPEVCRLLLERGADPLLVATHQGKTPFHIAAQDDALCRIFLDYKIDPNVESTVSGYKGLTPFLQAVESCSPEVVQMLIDHGADLEHEDVDVGNALAHAVYRKRMDNCKVLMQNGSDPHTASKDGKTLLHSAAKNDSTKEIITWLIQEVGIPVDATDNQGRTPLLICAEWSSCKTAKLLLKFGANVNAQNKKKETVLHRALRSSLGGSSLQFFLDAGADPRIKDSSGKAPLDYIHIGKDSTENWAVAPLQKALKAWEGKPLAVQDQPKEAKKKAAKPTAIVPLKKDVTLPTIINLALKPDFSLNDQLDKVHEFCGVILPDYDAFITQFGKGLVSGAVRVYPPNYIVKELDSEFRTRWSEYFLWDDDDSKLDDADLAKATILADTINGDEFVWFPGDDEDKKKKAGIYILPRDDYSIKYVGKDLGDIFKYTRKLFCDFPKDTYWFEGFIDLAYREYKTDKKWSLKELVKAIRDAGQFVHEVATKEYTTLFSTVIGGYIDIDSDNTVRIRCDKDADIKKLEKIVLDAGFKKTVEKMLE
ncbi:MAG: ankyrin repeat domain-containing protein [Planctomycetia bacterium]|nr:ankyrin repeat domain-containing protein [Planctomycetia bacterium]